MTDPVSPLIDQIHREEQLLIADRWTRRLWPFGLAILVFAWGFFIGVRHRAPGQQDEQTVRALHDITDSLKVVRATADSLKHSDSVAMALVLKERPRVNHASAQLHVSANPVDSAVTVERPVTGQDTLARSDTVVLLPLPVATFIREAKIQLSLDSVALQVKDIRIATLERADSLNVVRDSLHVVHETHLEDQADSAFRRGFVKGATVIVEVAALIGGVIKLVRLFGR